MQRAQAEAHKVPPPVSPLKKVTPAPVPPQKKPLHDSIDATEKEKTGLSAGTTPGSTKESSVPSTQNPPQQQDIKSPVQPAQKDDDVFTKSTALTKTASTKEESGFFGFGRSRSPSPQPSAPSVSGKVFGFGSSLLSSASNLISSSVQDETSTPFATQGVSAASQTPVKTTLTPATSQKGSADLSPKHVAKSVEEKQKGQKPEDKMTKVQEKAVMKKNDDKSEPPKTCPLCKTEIIKNPASYNTCTNCKSTVCNLCGFNPMPHQSEVRKTLQICMYVCMYVVVFISHSIILLPFIITLQVKEWLCLNCQMQKTPESSVVQPGPQTTKLLPTASPQKQSIPGVVAEDQELNASGKHDNQNLSDSKQPTLEYQMQKSDILPAKSDQPSKSEPPKQDSDFFSFGFGGSHSRSPSPQPTVSAISGKVLGFGSSFLSSASNLISSAVQDEPSKTPPTSRKGSTVSQTSHKTTPTPPTSRKGSVAPQNTKLNPPAVESKPTSTPNKEQEKPPDAQTSKPLQVQVKEEPPKICPLCKETLKKDPQNYSSCTSCKNIVCNLCGFNPNPHRTEVSLFIFITCKGSRFGQKKILCTYFVI